MGENTGYFKRRVPAIPGSLEMPPEARY